MDRRKLVCVDLFSGLGGFSEAFVQRGHKVVRIDNDPRFADVRHTTIADVTQLQYPSLLLSGEVDVVLASPPCEHFSVAGFPAGFPRDGSVEAIGIVACTFRLISTIRPNYYVVENPVGLLRKLIGASNYTVTLCQYGDTRMKPTDLWGRLPKSFVPKRCKNGDPCHERAPRGSRGPGTTQGMKDAAERARLPYELSLEVCKRIEEQLPHLPE